MAFDKLYIVNEMMIEIGEKTLQGLGEDAKSQRLATQSYEGTVEEVFAWRIDYKFATTRAELTQQTAEPISGYKYMYKLPKGCVRILSMINERGDEIQYKHRLEVYLYTENKKTKETEVLLTNETTCFIKYIVLRTNPARWKAWFRRLVILHGARKLCAPTSENDYRKLSLKQDLEDAVKDAKAANNAEDADVDSAGRNEFLGRNDVVESESGSPGAEYRGWEL